MSYTDILTGLGAILVIILIVIVIFFFIVLASKALFAEYKAFDKVKQFCESQSTDRLVVEFKEGSGYSGRLKCEYIVTNENGEIIDEYVKEFAKKKVI